MSDYLWDKTGEPEEDVARLEQLLGPLGHEPRPFVLPEEFSARTTVRNSFRPQRQRPFGWPRLALAASLLLTLLAGAWLIVRLQQSEVRHESAAQKSVAPQANEQTLPKQTAQGNNVNEQPTPQPNASPNFRPVNYRPTKRVSKHAGANARRRAPQPAAEQGQEQVAKMTPQRMTPQQKEATEQLLLALRIASAKYNYAQREVQELSAARKSATR